MAKRKGLMNEDIEEAREGKCRIWCKEASNITPDTYAWCKGENKCSQDDKTRTCD